MQDQVVGRTDPGLIAAARGDSPCETVLRGGLVLDVFGRRFVEADVGVFGGRVAAVVERVAGEIEGEEAVECGGEVLVPGFLDAHMHVESSMLPPSRFAALAVPRGTTGAVFDPHEIANVLGVAGIRWIARDAARAPMRAMLGLSSCVPSSALETAGAEIGVEELAGLYSDPEVGPMVVALAEMMNFPGVIGGDPGVLAKVALGLREGLVDGHAPGVRGRGLCAYAASGITSDHECTTAEEASDKLSMGMRVAIREGSAARNLDALIGLVDESNAHRFMFCTDDRHPGDLVEAGHIDNVIRRAIARGVRPETALCMGSLHVAEHYRLGDLGAIAPGRLADIVSLDDVREVGVRRVWHGGSLVARDGRAVFEPGALEAWPGSGVRLPEGFGEAMLRVETGGRRARVRVIEMDPHGLVSGAGEAELAVVGGVVEADASRDVLKMCVVERHGVRGGVGVGFVRNFGLRGGAIASTVGHDAHNLAVVGDDDGSMVVAARALAEMGGGQCVVAGGEVVAALALPIAGLMSDGSPESVIGEQRSLLEAARIRLGSPHEDPFMPLSFLCLPVIPHLKLTDLGLVDVDRFEVVPVLLD